MSDSNDKHSDHPVQDVGDHYLIYHPGGSVRMQRKAAIKATDNPMAGYENTIVMLCERLLAQEERALSADAQPRAIEAEAGKYPANGDALLAILRGIKDDENRGVDKDRRRGATHAVDRCFWAVESWLRTGARSATQLPIRGMPMIKLLKDQRDESADVLRRLMAKLREESGLEDPMEPFAYDASWEELAKQADAILAKCPSYTQQVDNVCAGLGITREQLAAALEKENPVDGSAPAGGKDG